MNRLLSTPPRRTSLATGSALPDQSRVNPDQSDPPSSTRDVSAYKASYSQQDQLRSVAVLGLCPSSQDAGASRTAPPRLPG